MEDKVCHSGEVCGLKLGCSHLDKKGPWYLVIYSLRIVIKGYAPPHPTPLPPPLPIYTASVIYVLVRFSSKGIETTHNESNKARH